ncbi:transcriptional repressor [Bombilactobacillus folatiphilus]|uniref:Transcriptional repressor n=1 Tax=Bombilactobacillus folatiphilus TaxID=2923362 RepID=A0ABY4P7Q9_9LACO|nr:Fur family transcriptional regulator [Bombilactobacillus folatiphilus]UQS81645.1 transcriptional repressor [Bombilactobacillus folatiphilus]
MVSEDLKQEFDKEVQRLKYQKVRMTPQRLEILAYMMSHTNHPTAEEVFNDLKTRTSNISIATVYNNLRFLATITPIDELTYDDRSIHFDYYHHEHFHAICTKCGKIYDVNYSDYPLLHRHLKQESGFEISKINLNIQGICKKCQKGVAKEEKS